MCIHVQFPFWGGKGKKRKIMTSTLFFLEEKKKEDCRTHHHKKQVTKITETFRVVSLAESELFLV
jgi:hypothetical protein